MKDLIYRLFAALSIHAPWPDRLYIPLVLILLISAALLIRLVTLLVHNIIIKKSVKKTRTTWDDILFETGVFKSLAGLVPPLFLLLVFPLFFTEEGAITGFLSRLILAIVTIQIILGIGTLLDAINRIYLSTFPDTARKRPIKGYLQMIKIFLAIIGVILVITGLLNASPVGILSGLGAMSAVLLLIFKDSIMGFVSSMQLSSNDMVRIGDWIEMPKYGADGDVIDVTLQTVKVRNWDMTITTIPIYALIGDSFKNWRGMSESGGRRIMRSIHLDMESVRFLSESDIDKLSRLPLLQEYMTKKLQEINRYNTEHQISSDDQISGRRLTNIGTFRAYATAYLGKHPKIAQDMIKMVRYLPSGPTGLPMELYVFCADKNWVHYEAVQADIVDHLLAILPEFGLRVFQEPSGWDLQAANKNLQKNIAGL